MGLFRQQAINAQRPSVIGELVIPPSQWIGRTVAATLLCFILGSVWTLTRQYQQTHAVRGITQYTQGEYAIVNQHIGEVTDIYVQPNQVVAQGQALFSLSHIANARFSKADLDAQVLQYQMLHRQLENKQQELKQAFAAEADFIHTSSNNTQQLIDNLSKQARIFSPELASLQIQYEKMTHLMKQKVVTNPQWIQAGSQLSAAKANMLRFEQETIEQQSQLALHTQQIALIRLKYAAQQDALQAQITQNNAQLQALAHQRSSTIYAPNKGIITRFTLQIGQTLAAQEQVAMLVPEAGQLVGSLNIPNFASGNIHLGQTVRLQLNAYPYKLYGMVETQITHIDTASILSSKEEAYRQNTLNTQVTLPKQWQHKHSQPTQANIKLRSGMTFTAHIVTQTMPLWQKIWIGVSGNAGAYHGQ
jgi:membrane fusion protein